MKKEPLSLDQVRAEIARLQRNEWRTLSINEQRSLLIAQQLEQAMLEPRGRTMPRYEFATMVNELRDIPLVQSKREKIVSTLRAFNIRPDAP